jgi:hydroxymethylglutaryl-CoA synthase
VHGHRFTGEPAYFHHIRSAATRLLDEMGRSASDYTYAIFHQPNAKFPQSVAKQLGFTPEQIAPGLLSPQVGNTYSAIALAGLCATLDVAQPGDTIFVTSYGSGAGADAYSLLVTEKLLERRDRAPLTAAYLARQEFVDYAVYVKWRNELVLG